MQSPVKWVPGVVLPGREVTAHLNPVPRLRMSRAILLLPPCFHDVERDNFNLQCELAPETSWLLLLLMMMIILVVMLINLA